MTTPSNCPPPLPAGYPHRLLLLTGGLLVLLLIVRAHFGLCVARGESMLPSLESGDFVLVDKLAYQHAPPERGDIVVARVGSELIVKRVVGLPGEEVELRQGQLFVNQRPLAEDHAVKPGWLSLRRGRLLADKYALLGDNRSLPVSVSVHAVAAPPQLIGKVIFSARLWPLGARPTPNLDEEEIGAPGRSAHLALGQIPSPR